MRSSPSCSSSTCSASAAASASASVPASASGRAAAWASARSGGGRSSRWRTCPPRCRRTIQTPSRRCRSCSSRRPPRRSSCRRRRCRGRPRRRCTSRPRRGRSVPAARVGAVTYRDRDDDQGAPGGARQSEAFVVKWTDLTFKVKKVQAFLDGIVAEGGGDWEEAVKDGLECAMRQLKWRSDAKKVIILVGSSPPHPQDVAAIHKLIADWRAKGGVVSTIDVSLMLHEEFERQMARWLHNEDLTEVSPLPEFYKEVSASFGEMAREGGGQTLAMRQQSTLVRHLLVLTFGPTWERDVARIARGF